MIKGIVCDEILRTLFNGSYNVSESLFERRDVSVWLNPAIGAAAKANFWENYNLGDKGTIDGGFLTSYTVPVAYSELRKKYYSDLPALPIAIEGGLGLYEIFPSQDPSSAFIITRAGNPGLFKGLAAQQMFGEPFARQEGKRVWYENINVNEVNIEEVIMNLIADTNGLSMDDELPCPADALPQVMDYVVQHMAVGAGREPDNLIDANPTKR